MRDLKIGVIGAGHRSSLARYAHKPGSGSQVVAICDVNEATLGKVGDKLGCEPATFTDYVEMLKTDLDAVMIVSPDHCHEAHTIAALERGLHVYLEKPMAITVEGCDRILQVAARTGNKLFVGHNMRYMTFVRKIREIIEHDEIGEVKAIWCRHFISYGGDAYYRDWHADRSKSTGLLLQKAAHDLDLFHYFAGSFTQRVSAMGSLSVYDKLPRIPADQSQYASVDTTRWPPLDQKDFNPVVDVEDQSNVLLQFPGGVLGSYMQCHFTPDTCRNFTIIGTHGRLENLGDGPQSPIFIWNRRTDSYNMIGDKVFRGGESGSSAHGGSDELIVEDFLHFVRGEKPSGGCPLAARMAVAVGCLATQSLREGSMPLDIPPVA